MKRLFLTLAIAAIGFTGAYAQTAPAKVKQTAEQKAEKSTAKLQKTLTLTADQKQKVYAIEVDKYKKAEAWHKESKANKKAQKAQHAAVKKQTDAQLDKVLTPAQKKKMDLIRKEKKDKKKKDKKDDNDSDGEEKEA